MDPLTIIGGTAAVAQLIGGVAKTIKTLHSLTGKLRDADTSILNFIGQLKTVKASLSRIKVWAQTHAAKITESDAEFTDQFDTAKENVEIALWALEADVLEMVKDVDNPKVNAMTRAKVVWREDILKSHKERLHESVNLLSLLVQVITTCSTEAEKTSLLREPRTQEVLTRVRIDTDSLKSASIRSTAASISDHTSIRSSMFGSTRFGFEQELSNSAPYQRTRSQQLLRAEIIPQYMHIEQPPEQIAEVEQPLRADIPVRSTSQRSHPSLGETIDSGLGSSIMSTIDELSQHTMQMNMDESIARTKPSPTPRRAQVSFGSISNDTPDTQSWSRPPIITSTPPNLSRTQSQKSDESKLRSRRSRLSLAFSSRKTVSEDNVQTPISPASSSRRSRLSRRADTDIHKSIELNLGQPMPPIVQAAQLGAFRDIETLLEQGADIDVKHMETGRSALCVAAHCGMDSIVSLLLQRNASTSIQDFKGMTPLHLAASRGHQGALELLLQQSITVDVGDKERKTAFRLAAENGYLSSMQTLLYHGARINSRDLYNSTALHSAARMGDVEVVDILLSNGADADAKDGKLMAAIHYAASGNSEDHEAIIKSLISKKGKSCLEINGEQGMSPLSYSAASGSRRITEYLINKGANIHHKDTLAMTPIHWAAYNAHDSVVDYFLSKRALVDARTTDGRTPLHLAISSPHEERFGTVELLLRKGAGIEVECNSGLRPLHYACDGADQDVIALLLGHGAKIDAYSQYRGQPIHIAANKGSVTVIQQLLQHNVYLDARDSEFERPLTLASSKGHIEVVKLLLANNVPVRSRFVDKGRSHEDSSLCLASRYGHYDIAALLLDHGASVWERDENGWLPLKHASYYGHTALIKLLLKHGATPNSPNMDEYALPGFFHPQVPTATRYIISRMLSDARPLPAVVQRRPAQVAQQTHPQHVYEMSHEIEVTRQEMSSGSQRRRGPIEPDHVHHHTDITTTTNPIPHRSFSVPSRPTQQKQLDKKPSRLHSFLSRKKSSIQVARANTTAGPSTARPTFPHSNTFPSAATSTAAPVSPLQSQFSSTDRPISTIGEQDDEWTPGDDVVSCETCQGRGLMQTNPTCDACLGLLQNVQIARSQKGVQRLEVPPVELPA